MKRIATAVTTFLMLAGLIIAPATLAQPTVDGDLTDADYIELGTVTGNSGFGDVGIASVSAYADENNLYIGIEGKLDISNSEFREFVIFVNADTPQGIASGTALPSGSDGLSPFGSLDGMILDAEVDYGIRVTGSPASNCSGSSGCAFASIVNYVDFTSGDAQDNFEVEVPSDGSAATGSNTGGSYAYQDASGLSTVNGTGLELSLPLSALGATGADNIQLFVFHGQVENDQVGAHIFPDDGTDTQYSNSEDWTQVNGTQFTTPDPLPVELAGFDAQLDGRAAMLTWRTLSETNNDRFEIEHAAPGQSYQTIGTREGQGTTDQPTNYSFRVADLDVGTHQFRLRQIDVDGTPHLSPVERVEVGTQGLAVIAPQPHPVVSSSTVGISVEETSPVTVELYNLLGQRVRTLYDGTLTPGRVLDVEIDATQLPSGTYFVRTTSDLGQNTQRVAVIR